jgi:putative ABC transport system permease protein
VLDAVSRALVDSAFYQRMGPEQVAALGGRYAIDFRLGPLAEAYLDPTIDERNEKHGDRQTILGLAAVGLLILLLAATNYVNLATVRTLRRQREIAVRKVLGASAPAVSRQFLAESVLVCLIATGFGLLLAWLLLPVFADLVQRKLDDIFTPGSIAVGILLGAGLGLVAGAYPTWSALRVRPTSALAGRGNSETAGGLWLRPDARGGLADALRQPARSRLRPFAPATGENLRRHAQCQRARLPRRPGAPARRGGGGRGRCAGHRQP